VLAHEPRQAESSETPYTLYDRALEPISGSLEKGGRG
jgi:hypothetical protein